MAAMIHRGAAQITSMVLLERWRVALQALPYVAVAVAARAVIWATTDDSQGWIEQSIALSFVSTAIFVSALMLQGVIADYKESEKLPTELETAFSSVLTAAQVCIEGKGAKPLPAYKAIYAMLDATVRVLDNSIAYSTASEAISRGEISLCTYMEKFKSATNTVSPHGHSIRNKVSRLQIIRCVGARRERMGAPALSRRSPLTLSPLRPPQPHLVHFAGVLADGPHHSVHDM
jgi:hypothetical protein